MLKRTVIKLSGEALSGNPQNSCEETLLNSTNSHFCDTTIDSVSVQLREALDFGTEIALVVGGGNFFRGRALKDVMEDRVKADQIGMLATVINAIYLSDALKARHNIHSVVMTPMPFANMTTVYDKHTALSLMAEGIVTIHAAGLCHPYFSTDSVTALRGAELEADCVLFTKNDVEAVYDKDPKKKNEDGTITIVKDARKYKTVSYKTAIQQQLQFADAAALQILKEAETIPSFVFGENEENGIIRACKGAGKQAGFGTFLSVDIKEEFYVNSY